MLILSAEAGAKRCKQGTWLFSSDGLRKQVPLNLNGLLNCKTSKGRHFDETYDFCWIPKRRNAQPTHSIGD